MSDAQRAVNRAAYGACHRPAIGHRDQVDVLAEATCHQVGPREGGAAEEDQIVGMRLEGGKNRRDQMVAVHLVKSYAELLCDGCCFVSDEPARVGHRAHAGGGMGVGDLGICGAEGSHRKGSKLRRQTARPGADRLPTTPRCRASGSFLRS